jgi:predicted transport protein
MGDIRIFKISGDTAQKLSGSAVALEKSLQTYIEHNLEALLGIRFIASEYSTGKTHGGRIDTLGIDENGCPVIIEYKRALNENVINQGLYYLDWLLDHKAEFELKTMKVLGLKEDNIEWIPRLLCIAGDFTKYDVHAVQQISRNIELIKYQKYGDELLLLELVNATNVQNSEELNLTGKITTTKPSQKTFEMNYNQSDIELRDLYDTLRAFIEALGDDVQVNKLKFYMAFKRISNFACVEIRPQARHITVYVKINPDSITLEPGFTRDVRNIGHYGTGDLEIIIKSGADLKKAEELISRSYDNS